MLCKRDNEWIMKNVTLMCHIIVHINNNKYILILKTVGLMNDSRLKIKTGNSNTVLEMCDISIAQTWA
jgi:hypothetical protein